MAPIIETIIGLIFIYLIFSLITSWIVEYMAMRFQRRGKMLHKFLTEALNDRFNKNWGLMLYDHPLIEVLGREIYRPKGILRFLYNNRLGVKRRLPFYISAEQFATTLIDIIINHDKDVFFRKSAVTGNQELINFGSNTERSYDLFIRQLDKLGESEVKRTLTALVRNVSTDSTDKYEELKTQLVSWFDNGMDRLTGWYKRDTRKRLFITGLAVTLFFNINSFIVFDRMYTDPQLRSAVNDAAIDFIAENETLPNAASDTSAQQLRQRINALSSELEPLNLPIGWGKAKTGSDYLKAIPHNWLGWLITAFALSFGAPFWFDALKKIVNVRSSGISPKK